MRRIVTVALLLAWTTAFVALNGCSSESNNPNTERSKQIQEHWKAKMPVKKPDAKEKK